MIASPLASAQDFIKALRAHPDTHANGSSKIELARKAWDSINLDFPNKDEVVVDWLLTRLLKDKAKAGWVTSSTSDLLGETNERVHRNANPILDSRYWELLSDILCSPDEEAKHADASPTARRWLLPLLNRIPVAPIVRAYLTLSASLDKRDRTSLNEPVARCLAVLWPLASLKFSPDTLLECFGALLAYLVSVGSEEDHRTDFDSHVVRIGALLVSSYRTAYGNTVNKRKVGRGSKTKRISFY